MEKGKQQQQFMTTYANDQMINSEFNWQGS